MTARFAVTLFVSAALLFTCQPLVARMLLPLFGGASAVWIVCSLCFQALLLAGYGYAHVSARRLPLRAQVALQIALVVAAFLVLPIHIDAEVARAVSAERPTVGLVLLLLRTVGLPFFVIATTSPLLQRWFAELGETDPYFLYASSNAGSMLALLGYPLVLEPQLTLHAQSRAMQIGFAAYAVLLALCGWTAIRHRAPPPAAVVATRAERKPIGWRERLLWIALAFAPSSLLLGATQYMTTDIASVPLLWVLPLAAYLASFIVAFARSQPVPDNVLSRAFAVVAVVVALLLLGNLRTPALPILAAHVVLVFLASTVCHRALARRRPHVSHLTEFYLLISVGGVLGGAFNGILAPLVFPDLYELPLAIGATLVARAALVDTALDRRGYRREIAIGVALSAIVLVLAVVLVKRIEQPSLRLVLIYALPVLLALHWSGAHPIRSGIAIGAVLLIDLRTTADLIGGGTTSRGFFGVLHYSEDEAHKFRVLVDGRTIHGRQAIDEKERANALSYYHATGPAGEVLSEGTRPRRVVVIGLGAGALAAYVRAGDHWTFFEINPEVVALAKRHFTYLSDAAQRGTVDVEVGDGRLLMAKVPDDSADVVVLDAFSSDAIPTHLMTKEAVAIYRRVLKPDGIVLANVSNLILRLQPVFGAAARDAGIGALQRIDMRVPADLRAKGKDGSEWVILSEDAAVQREGWTPIATPPAQRAWTDDFISVLSILR